MAVRLDFALQHDNTFSNNAAPFLFAKMEMKPILMKGVI
jgi:hypothetical protein